MPRKAKKDTTPKPTAVTKDGRPVYIVNKVVNSNPLNKNLTGLYGSVFDYQNLGKYRSRYYTLGDTSQGLDTLSRELLVRWSREMYAQLPFVGSAIKCLSDFSIGDAYLPEYHGKNKEWWKQTEEWLIQEWYSNCCVKGKHFDFQTCLNLESNLLSIDGDYLLVYGQEGGFPKFQIIQNNRIRSQTNDNFIIKDGPYAGTILSDGVYYTPQGKAVAYNVQNAENLVNNFSQITKDVIFSAKDAHLILDPEYIDKTRGIPAIGKAILQALSIQELDGYLMEKIKIQSSIALVEKTPSGEAPVELQNTLEQLQLQQIEGKNGNTGFIVSPNTHAIDIKQGSDVRYIHAEGGEITLPSTNGPSNEAADYMERLEAQILSTIGVPHTLMFSNDKVSGRVTSAVADLFRKAISHRQKIMDKRAKFCVTWAICKAMDEGLIPRNDDENIFQELTFTHPKQFSLDQKYDNQITTDNYNNGFSTLNEATTTLFNKSAEETLNEQAQEQILFFQKAKEVSEATQIPVETVIQSWRNQVKPAVPTQQPSQELTA